MIKYPLYHLALLLLVLLSKIRFTRCQDLSIYGKYERYTLPISSKERGAVYSTCFSGLGIATCKPYLATDDAVIQSELPSYRDMMFGVEYCLECCGRTPNNVDVWDLSCALEAADLFKQNLFGMEFRLGRNQFLGDMEIVVCPLKRTGCTYDDKQTILCNQAPPGLHLSGYTLTIVVQQYDSNFAYWNGVESCEAVAIEVPYPLNVTSVFTEKIILVHKPVFRLAYRFDGTKIGFIFLAVFVFTYGSLYFCRRGHCVYCFKKLVFSTDMCYICQFVGAQKPDPFLLKALDEKSENIQGIIPERFPGSTKVVSVMRGIYRSIKFFCKCICMKDEKILPYAELLKATTDLVNEKKESGYLVLDEYGYIWGTETKPNKKEKKRKKVVINRLNPNLIKYAPNAIYYAAGHFDPAYREKYKEEIKETVYYDENGMVKEGVDIMIMKHDEEEAARDAEIHAARDEAYKIRQSREDDGDNYN